MMHITQERLQSTMNGLLSKNFLNGIGVNLDDQTYQAFSVHYEDTLNERVISQIIDELDEPKLAELHALQSSDSSILQDWLVANVPQISEIIEDEVAILLGEIVENSQQL